jgi:glycosyltransferase involved in cell wall biosynthesis
MTVTSFFQIYKRKKYYSAEYIKRILLNSPTTPGISIVAPAYNEETTVVDNVRSLLDMDYPTFEIIIVNDGSKDKTLEKLIESFDLEEVPYNYIEHIKTKPYKRLFKSRNELLKVKGIGEKAYKQCVGFLRVPESKEVLDNTSVHPESYEAAYSLLKLLGYTEADVRNRNLGELKSRLEARGSTSVASELGIGVPTLNDIISELEKPGRDPRDELPPQILRTDAMDISSLKTGMEFVGTVRNVADFGAFVDIGVHQDGLVHISKLSDKFVKRASDIVKVGDIIKVRVIDVDVAKKRISLEKIR